MPSRNLRAMRACREARGRGLAVAAIIEVHSPNHSRDADLQIIAGCGGLTVAILTNAHREICGGHPLS